MDEKLKEFNHAVIQQASRYRMVKRENPIYLVVNAGTLAKLTAAYFVNFSQNGDIEYHNLKVLVDNALPDYYFRVVGE